MKYVSIGIFAHNEEQNIRNSILSVTSQKLPQNWKIKDILIIVSGSTDNTASIVKKLKDQIPNLKLIEQKSRKGKVNAVSTFLKNTSSYHLVILNADSVVSPNSFLHLLKHFNHKDIGLVCGRIVPQNDPDTFFGFAAQLQWDLHHRINLSFPDRPKAGELVAFKRVFKRLHQAVPTDEANIEAIIKTQGYHSLYAPNAHVEIFGPDNFTDFLHQRRRIYAQHLIVRQKQAYQVVTMSNFRLLGTFLTTIDFQPQFLAKSFAVMLLETTARFLAIFDVVIKKRTYHQWAQINSTKKSLSPART